MAHFLKGVPAHASITPRSDVEAQSAAYTASLRMAAPPNGAPFNGTWKMSVAADPETREQIGWPAEFEEWQTMTENPRKWLQK